MNVVKAVRDYVEKMVKDVPGMKAVILDRFTTQYLSLVYSQSEILQKEVYVIDKLENAGRAAMQHLKAVIYVRPSEESVSQLVAELRAPKYGQYYIYFSNQVKKSQLEQLAEADEHEVVKEVLELYADFLAVNPGLFSLGITGCMLSGARDTWEERAMGRAVEGLSAALLSLRRRPVIRYAKMSNLAKGLATELTLRMQSDAALWQFGRNQDVPPLLMILDRRDDPVTPLLNQWTYQSMVHELLGIYNNRVDLSNIPDTSSGRRQEKDELKEVSQNLVLLTEEFQKHTQENKKIESIEDMKAFIERYPKFKQMSGNVVKHVTVFGEIVRRINLNDLYSSSEIEQNLACQNVEHAQALEDVRSVIDNNKATDLDRLRVALLYALRFERNSSASIPALVDLLNRRGVHPDLVAILSVITRYAGADVRASDVFGNKSIISFTKKALKGLKGVDNIFTQHEPYLVEVLDSLMKNKLKDQQFPWATPSMRERPQDIILFVVGGVTYEEAVAVDKFSRATPGNPRILLGGTNIHNTFSFLEEVEKSMYGPRNSIFVERKLRGAAPPKTEVIKYKSTDNQSSQLT
ncbi:vacuolar protein sorting-associated protein 45 [Capsaspora owczarzaki ATCC 30864]|uniref:Vacuolar protein sorting-associated protein 45 n=1 Tax=Capsaspora owczarzaki (strain ATCC 30864) TaxID=595528 RepID=A0A0D2X183_CAPO3|nr:vacuolar protein sorting-associated protein 45 [Capsaspora owczarzaki ATCC 30864]KJE90359.1 vacuolar protein sorting-associated protein 45 [Capsaspora owczarzaki ATCC 30864]|eukprot:XP_004364549.1 vacuolar protein sorting-associated protein 45 [Capsaspora owczarzaki ATCC 30864]